jgi:hypothetical protein
VPDFSGITKATQHVQSSLEQMQKTTAKVMSKIATIVSVVAIGKTIKDSINLAMDVESSLQQIKRIMGESSNQFLKWVETQALAYNMSKSEALQYGSVFGNLIKGFTKDTSQVMNYTEQLLQASAVVASATGRSMEDVMERIRSGLLGNTEAIEDLGVYAQVSMLKSTDAFKKFANGKTWDQLDFQTQQQIRLMSILEQVNKNYGNTVLENTNASQQKLIATMKNVQLSLGNAFLPIYQIILPALTALATQLAYVMNIVAQFSQALFGKTSNAGAQQAKNTQAQAAAMTDLGDATKEAGKAAKGAVAGFDEINNLSDNSNSGSTTDSTSAAMSSIATNGIADSTGGISKDIQAMADSVKNSLGKINFQPLIDTFGKLKSAIEPFTQTLFSGLKWFYDNILVPYATWYIEDYLPAFLDLLASTFKVLNPLLQSFMVVGEWLWNNFLQPIASWTGGVVVDSLNQLSEVLGKIGDWMANNKDIVIALLAGITAGLATYAIATYGAAAATALWSAVSAMATGFTTALGVAIAFLTSPIGIIVAALALLTAGFVYFYRTNEGFRGVVDAILNQIEEVALNLWNNVLVPFGKFLKDVFVAAWDAVKIAAEWLWKNVLVPIGDFLLWFWNNVLVPVGKILVDVLGIAFKFVADVAKSLWENVLVPLADFFTSIFGPTVEAIQAIFIALWENTLNPIATFLTDVFKLAWQGIITVLQFLWNDVLKPLINFLEKEFMTRFNTVLEGIKGIIEGLKTTFIGLMNFITGVFTGDWEKAWNGVKDIFKGIFDSFYSIVKVPLNLVIDAINTVIRGLNKIKIDVPDWVSKVTGISGSWGFNINEITHLANGGITNGEMLAVVGDNPGGREVVSPLNDLMDMISNAVGNAMMATSQFNQSTSNNQGDIVIQVDGTTLARVMHPYNSKETSRIGNSLITTT